MLFLGVDNENVNKLTFVNTTNTTLTTKTTILFMLLYKITGLKNNIFHSV